MMPPFDTLSGKYTPKIVQEKKFSSKFCKVEHNSIVDILKYLY